MITVVAHRRAFRFPTPGENITAPIATPSCGAKELLLIHQEQAPGGANPMHSKSAEAVIYLLEGAVEVVTDSTTTSMTAGDAAIVPPGDAPPAPQLR